jgi:hypothetical protein
MTEERSCGTCGHYVSDMCVRPGGCCFHHSKWQPIAQKEPMENKVIFESEEHYIDYYSSLYGAKPSPWQIEENKKYGYIRKSAVEKAEEMYKEWLNRIGYMSETVVMYKMYLAIQELKSEIERLKK